MVLHTSLKPEFSCCLANVEILGLDPSDVTEYLWNTYRIIVTPIKHAEFQGLRVTPNLYTTLEELDRFCDAMEEIADHGIPAKG
jgi:selenocysteine lyase/cysteine desulfurase